jgi:membrane protease YdiL (CAAX protease family)
MLLSVLLLAACLGGLAWFLRNDIAEYAAFKLLTQTADRQRRYQRWLLKSFLLFVCGALACLAILRRLHAIAVLPPEFAALSHRLRAVLGNAQLPRGEVAGLVGGMLAGMLGGMFLLVLLMRRSKGKVKVKKIGDIDALMPRNAAETLWMALISVNAGLGEELFFRLLLPLLLTLTTGSALLACLLATLIFGLVHMYQGIAGVLATSILGLAFMVLYLWTGTLWIAMLAHAILDIVGVTVRPALERAARPAH